MSRAEAHEVLRGAAGARACLLGNVAIARGALEAGVQFFSCYPGTPSSEIGDTMARVAGQAGVTFEYSVNEKIAVEIAFAACLAGARSMCSMKHLGLNYANDPVSTMPYVGVEGGMVIVSAGDPSAITSPNEQDQRHFSPFLYYPILDPATPDDALRMTRFAFELSEETRLPVIIRPTTRVCHGSGMVELGPLPEAKRAIEFVKDPPRHVPIPPNARRMRPQLSARFKRAEERLGASEFFGRRGAGKYGVVASGVAWAYAAQVIEDLGLDADVTLQQIGGYPIPQRVLLEFLETVESVLVVEELTPFVEDQVSLCAFRHHLQVPVLGKHSGHFPVEFEYTPELVEDALRQYLGLEKREVLSVTVPELPPRPPVLCPGCPHRASFLAARRAFGRKTVYCNDIGCYTLGYGEPLDTCDVVLCMGSSISQASGIARTTGRRTVAFIGDSTFYHSGLPALANAVQADDQVTVVILDNFVTAMTGFQPSPTTGEPAAKREAPLAPPPRFSIEATVRGLGVTEVFSVNPFDEKEALAALRAARHGTGVNVVVCRAPCAVVEGKAKAAARPRPMAVDQEVCNACSLCVRLLGCPAISIEGDRYVIDRALCNGCAVCAGLCQHDAIHPVAPEKGTP
jgi:indolepyruvate ferredoxin oxidoreductase alpha subunit